MKEYYDALAPGYDEWYRALGRFDGLDPLHWDDELRVLEQTIASLAPVKTLDLACGTGFLTRHLRGEVTGLDQSERMVAVAREQVSTAALVQGDAFDLPFPDESFDRLFATHFYGHLEEPERARFLAEARRVASRRNSSSSTLHFAPTGRRSSDRNGSWTTAHDGRSTSATSRPTGSPRSSAAARSSTRATGSSS